MAQSRGPSCGFNRRRHERVRGSRLLFESAKSSRLRQGNRSTRRYVSERGGRTARASGRRRLYRRSRRSDRLRSPDSARRRQYRARSGATHGTGKADRSRTSRTRSGGARAGAKTKGRAISLRRSWTSAPTLCRPRNPTCGPCPLVEDCAAFQAGVPEVYPRRAEAKARPRGRALCSSPAAPTAPSWRAAARLVAFWLRPLSCRGRHGQAEGPDDGLAGAAPVDARWRRLPGDVEQVFTHFALKLTVYAAEFEGGAPAGCFWVEPEAIGAAGFSSVMRKAVKHALTQT